MRQVTVLANWHAFVVTAEAMSPLVGLGSTGLVAIEGDQAVVYTGVWGGDVSVAGELLSSSPDESAGWEAVVEFSARVSAERPLQVESRLEGPAGGPIATAAGSYAVRVSARGRDTAYDLVADGTEEYLVQVWPAAERALRVVRLDDRIGRSLSRSGNDRV